MVSFSEAQILDFRTLGCVFFENPSKIDVWGSLEAFLEPLDKRLGHRFAKDAILEAFGSILGA